MDESQIVIFAPRDETNDEAPTNGTKESDLPQTQLRHLPPNQLWSQNMRRSPKERPILCGSSPLIKWLTTKYLRTNSVILI